MVTIKPHEFKKLADFVKRHYGIHLREEKRSMIANKLQSLILRRGFVSFSDYFEHILSDRSGKEAGNLVNIITTNHTYFMRETAHYHFFKQQVLPYLKISVADRDLRIWSAGCSTGEEPYTLAMIMDEFFGPDKSKWDTKILATDISSKVLDIASKGIYHKEDLETLPLGWRSNYFRQWDEEHEIVADKIRNEVIFRQFNLMDRFPFKRKFHVIFCRNVMIYFDNPTKWELVNKFYEMTEPGGYLFIGHAESLQRDKTKYKYVMPAVYRKE